MKFVKYKNIICWISVISFTACGIPKITSKKTTEDLPTAFNTTGVDTFNSAQLSWKAYFKDPNLMDLIDSTLIHNQELNILQQEIAVSGYEIRVKKGEYLPHVNFGAGAGVDKKARYTNIGAMEAQTEMSPGKEMPDPLSDLSLGAYASWELDIWHKLHNAKYAAVNRYLATVEGKHFMQTQLIAEVANHYYELIALDQQLNVVKQNIAIQNNALEIVRLQKLATRVTELAVKKFEAEVYKTQSLQYEIEQKIALTENSLNFLLGRYPQRITRTQAAIMDLLPQQLGVGVPTALLSNRPDIMRAEYALKAADLDVKVAKAKFYPAIGLSAGVGLQGFNPTHLIKAPESILYNIAGDLVAPLINKNGIKADYLSANAKQIQAVYEYEKTVLNAYVEVNNELQKISNLKSNIELKSKQVAALNQSILIVNDLFTATRADYMEVLMTQRDALESKFDLIESQQNLMKSCISIYKSLGGGWR